MEKQLGAQRFTMATSLQEFKKLQDEMTNIADKATKEIEENAKLKGELRDAQAELKLKSEECGREKAAAMKMSLALDAAGREKERLRRQLDEEKRISDDLRTEVETFEKLADQEAIRAKATERVVARLDREKLSAEKRVVIEAGKVESTKEALDKKIVEVHDTEVENKRLMAEAGKMRGVIAVLERDRERIRGQVEEGEKRLREVMDEVRTREIMLDEAEAKAVDLSTKLKQGQAAYEHLKTEKLAISKELAQAMDDVAELKRKNKVQGNQIEQLKGEVHAKDKALVAEEFEHQSVEKRLEQRSHEVEQLKRLLDEANLNITKQDNEIGDLNATIRRLDAEALAQKRAYDQVVTERDILGTQLIRRNDELALLYEKLSIQASRLSKGETQYTERVQDIRLLRLKIKDLQRELTLARASASTAGVLKKEVEELQKELMKTQLKLNRLSDKYETPMNVHHWRRLEGTDPSTFELIQKVQTLQKRLIAKTEEVVERDMVLSEKERMYAELKAMLARQPGPEIAEALTHYQHLLSERTRQLKALASEMQLYQTELAENKYEVERLTKQLLDAKKAYFDLRNKEKLGSTSTSRGGSVDGDFAARAAEAQRTQALASGPRFVGGGFAVSTAT